MRVAGLFTLGKLSLCLYICSLAEVCTWDAFMYLSCICSMDPWLDLSRTHSLGILDWCSGYLDLFNVTPPLCRRLSAIQVWSGTVLVGYWLLELLSLDWTLDKRLAKLLFLVSHPSLSIQSPLSFLFCFFAYALTLTTLTPVVSKLLKNMFRFFATRASPIMRSWGAGAMGRESITFTI